MSDQESLQCLFDRFRGGDQDAATDIWNRFEDSIVRLADQQIGPHMRSKIQPESVMLSVMELALQKIADGKYRADSPDNFWNLLRRITGNKIRNRVERYSAEKRDFRRNVSLEDDDSIAFQDEGPSPAEKVELAETLEVMRSKLKPPSQEVFDLMLEGHGEKDIAEKLQVSPHTARRRMKRIFDLAKEQAATDAGE
jgi:RNA polymerase sigma-70 factor, ECF subfamily